jgi:hypothetical protein
MKPNKITSAVVALAIAAALGTSARAQAIYNPGDLIIGFQQSGAGNSYEVDLGSVTQFINPTQPTETFDLSVSDLSAAFTNWNSDSQGATSVQWGVIGGSNKNLNGDLSLSGGVTLPADTLFYTIPGATAPTEKSHSTQETYLTNIAVLDGQFNGAATTAGSTSGLNAVDIASSTQGSFAYENGTKDNFGLGGAVNTAVLTSTSTGPIGPVLDLYELTPTNADVTKATALLGDFTLSSGGVLTFAANVPATVPEPSSYALMGLGAAFLLWRLRRKASSVL